MKTIEQIAMALNENFSSCEGSFSDKIMIDFENAPESYDSFFDCPWDEATVSERKEREIAIKKAIEFMRCQRLQAFRYAANAVCAAAGIDREPFELWADGLFGDIWTTIKDAEDAGNLAGCEYVKRSTSE